MTNLFPWSGGEVGLDSVDDGSVYREARLTGEKVEVDHKFINTLVEKGEFSQEYAQQLKDKKAIAGISSIEWSSKEVT